MRVIFQPNGTYADNEQSFPPGTADKTMKEAAAKHYGGSAKAYIVRETAEPTPWLCRLQDNEIVPDPVKVAAALDADTVTQARNARLVELHQKVLNKIATVKELCEYVLRE